MANYEGYYHKSILSVANLNELGIVNFDEMGTMPFFSVHFRGKHLPIKSDKHCKETNGDCFKLVLKYLDFKWKNAIKANDSYDWKI